jgi:hypothetical protein
VLLFVIHTTGRLHYEMMNQYDIETGSIRDEPVQLQFDNPKMKHDEDMAIRVVESERNDAAVTHVDTSSNFVFSGFHELNLFILLKLENKLMRTRRKLYHLDGRARSGISWNDDETEELRSNLKQYRNASNSQSNLR